MLLVRWCPFKIQKEIRTCLQFTSTDYLCLLLTNCRIRFTIPLNWLFLAWLRSDSFILFGFNFLFRRWNPPWSGIPLRGRRLCRPRTLRGGRSASLPASGTRPALRNLGHSSSVALKFQQCSNCWTQVVPAEHRSFIVTNFMVQWRTSFIRANIY
jgi:hypothetical protein